MPRFIAIILCLVSFLHSTVGRHVEVDVSASWPRFSTSFLTEIGEFLSEEEDQISKSSPFWRFQDELCKYSQETSDTSQLNSFALDAALKLLPVSSHSLLEVQLGLGYYAPAVEFFHTLAQPFATKASESCPSLGENQAFVVLGSRLLCSLADVDNALSTATSSNTTNEIEPNPLLQSHADAKDEGNWDHSYTSSSTSSSSNKVVAVLFGSYASPSFCSLYEALKRHTDEGTVASFAVRPAFHGLAPLSATSSLQGYGVFLDIKNMEYKNVDDASTPTHQPEHKTEQAGAEEVFDAEEEVQGINFHKLRQHNPSLSEEISMLRHSIRAVGGGEGDQGGEMKVWRMKDFGLQLLQLTSSLAGKETAFHALMKAKEWVHNFPKYASMISSTKVTSSLKQAMTSLYHHPLVNALPTNALFVNDKRIELGSNTLNVFDVLAVVRAEIHHLTRLHSLRLSSAVTRLLKTAVLALTSDDGEDSHDSDGSDDVMGGGSSEVASLEKDIVRIDVSKGGKYVVHFLNNLDKDKLYSRTLGWPKTLTTLLYPSWNLHTIARNLYTLVAHVDVLSPKTATLLQAVKMLYQEQFPIRLGVAPYCGVRGEWSAELPEEEALRLQVCRLYASLLGKEGSVPTGAAVLQALDFLEKIGVSLENGGILDMDHLLAIYSQSGGQGSAVEMKKRLLQTDEFMHFVRNSSIYYTERNLPTSCFSFNGIVVTDDVTITNSLMRLIGREQYLLSHYVRTRRLSDRSKSIFSDIMQISGAFARHHPLLQEKKPHYLPNLLASSTSSSQSSSLAERVLTSLPPSLTAFLAPFLSTSSNTSYTPAHTLFAIFPTNSEGLASAHALLSAHLLAAEGAEEEKGEEVPKAMPKARTQISLTWRPVVTPSSSLCEVEVEAGSEGGLGRCVEGKGVGSLESDVAVAFQHLLNHLLAPESRVCTRECVEVVHSLLSSYISHKHQSHSLEEVLGEVSRFIEASDYTGFDRASLLSLLSSLSTSSEAEKEAQRQALREEYSRVEKTFQLRPCTSSAEGFLIFNNRVLSLSTASFLPLDVDLLTSLELKKTERKAVHRLFQEVEKKTVSSQSVTSFYTSSLQRFALLNFLWHSSAPSSSSASTPMVSQQRFDLQQTMSQMYDSEDPTATSLWSSIVYQVEPLLSAENDRYWQNGNDLSITVVIDPLSLAGQRGLALVELLREHLHYTTSVVLLPKLEITDFPLQQFYRFVLSPSTALSQHLLSTTTSYNNITTTATTESGSATSAAKAVFSNLPRQHVLTTRLDVAELWNVQTRRAVQDIDNLRCSAAGCGDGVEGRKEVTSVSFALKNLLVSGQCFQTTEEVEDEESPVGSPPNGLQLTLSSLTSPSGVEEVSDTLVMQNLGYYQLQSRTPSLYLLSLSPGKSSYLYRIRGSGEGGGKLIAIKSFNDQIRRLIVVKRSGREHLSLLDTSSEEEAAREAVEQGSGAGKGFWENLKSSIFGASSPSSSSVVKSQAEGEEEEVMHIFSLATGHLYERFLRIMMLSVVKHASLRVKFWLFENYLSPAFKDVAAQMSARYGFDIGYVTYKWPQWLRQQTQQQRIIWGYKILFLDVLFPLSVKRVIYVDADQVVRADLKELWQMDLQGAPYAYTPFCTSREETLGFQFWRSGYWKDHLQGRPYHISALYVVDLQTFRRHMVGDQLRAIYDQLSRDPNSLANLDQDLPNYAQHQVPIFSLPQHWLWCETWCSDKSKSKAKTIDLCNNPLHKEPKLDMAKRIISGKLFNESWVQLDEEIASLSSMSV